MKKKHIVIIVVASIFSFTSILCAQEKATIIVSGQSHASLYPCNCPRSPNGGVARRATLIKDIRAHNKNVLLLEAGGSFAGGKFDQNSQASDTDKKRSDIYMSSLTRMGYDAFLISSEEFNFGQEFLDEMRSKNALNYLSLNLEGDFLPFIIKKVGSFNIAVIGITDPRVKTKSSLKYVDPQEVLAKLVSELTNNKEVQLIVVLAYLEKKDSIRLIQQVEGIDIWISSNNPFRSAQTEKVNATTLVMPAWETRSLTKIALMREPGQPVSIAVENVVLNSDILDDKEERSIIPACFSSVTCAKPGSVGRCVDGGTRKARCDHTDVKPITMTVIKPKVCLTCDTQTVIDKIKQVFPSVRATIIEAHTPRAKKLMKKLDVTMLPVYLIDESVESEQTKVILDRIAKKVDTYYMIEKSFSGVSYFAKRKKIANRLDVFFDIATKDIVGTLAVLEELKEKNTKIDVRLHFLMIEDPKHGFLAKGGTYEIEEYLRSACIDNYYPDKLWPYLSCRLAAIESSWWDDCVVKFDMDPQTIKTCAQSEEGKTLLNKFIRLTQELEVVFGPTFVINNQEIFSSKGRPSLEELEKLFKQ